MGVIKNIITTVRNTFDTRDKALLKPNTLLIGKNDKNISVVDECGNIISIYEPISSSQSANGRITFPTLEGNILIRYGEATVQANAVTEVNFPNPFPNICDFVMGCQKSNDPVTGATYERIDNTKFKVTLVGGSGSEVVSWYAVGR